MKSFKYSTLVIAFFLLGLPAFAQNTPNGTTAPAGSVTTTAPLPGAILQQTTAQSPYTNFNYVRTIAPRVPTQAVQTTLINAGNTYGMSTTYTGGWGQNLQVVTRGSSIVSKSIVQPYENRTSLKSTGYLPYPDSPGSKFQINPTLEQKNYYLGVYPNEGATAAGLTTQTSANNLTTSYAFDPGKSRLGQSRGVKSSVVFNTTADDIKILGIDASGNPVSSGTYAANTLTVKMVAGYNQPHTPQIQEFKNENGQLLCKKVKTGSNYLITYYVYDDIGRIRYILPPKAVVQLASNSWNFTNTAGLYALSLLCFSYNYNEFGQLIEKKSPDRTGYELIVYDKKQRPVLTQTPLMEWQNLWNFTVYDNMDRPVMTGTCTSAGVTGSPGSYSRAEWQDAINAFSTTTSTPVTLFEFIENGFQGVYPSSITGCEILTYNYYDKYAAYTYTDPVPTQPVCNYSQYYTSDFQYGAEGEVFPTKSAATHGLLTASKVKIIDPGNIGGLSQQWISSVFYYDEKGRVIQTETLNPWNTVNWDVNCTQYDFSGHTILSIAGHNSWSGASPGSVAVKTRYTYQGGLLRSVDQQINYSAYRNLARYEYDDMNVLKKKTLGDLIDENYTYNIRGQLTGINGAYSNTLQPVRIPFAESLSYDYGFDTARYDGSISGFIWKTRSFPAGNFSRASYGYNYDDVGRMTSADYREYSSANNLTNLTWNTTNRNYSVGNITYDENGNMLTMQQRGPGAGGTPALIDDLSYYYIGNQLYRVSDAGADAPALEDFKTTTTSGLNYMYDADGNLMSDADKGLALTYNQFDLPTEVTASATGMNGYVKNVYDAAGNLLAKTIKENGVFTDYRYWGPFVYRNDHSTTTNPWKLDYFLHPEGRCRWIADSSFYKYDYFVKDHLGNVRSTMTADEYDSKATYRATAEIASANIEGLLFAHLDEVRADNPDGQPDDGKSMKLNGSEEGRKIGTAIILQAMEGDKIQISSNSYYDENGDPNMNAPGEQMLGAIFAALNGYSGFADAYEGANADIVNGLFSSKNYMDIYDALKENQTDPGRPRAYLNYLVFNEDFDLIEDQSGAIQVSGETSKWSTMSPPEITVGQNGYVAVYLSNEQYMDVYFDNLRIVHYRGRMLEEQHYYPHGLLMKKTASNTTPENKYQYQTKKMQDELGMHLYDFHARQYDPQIGRFWGVDPADQFPSGYTGMGNNPANFVDPTGMVVTNRVPTGDMPEQITGHGDQVYETMHTIEKVGGSGGGDPGMPSDKADYQQQGQEKLSGNTVANQTSYNSGEVNNTATPETTDNRGDGKKKESAAERDAKKLKEAKSWDKNGDGKMSLKEANVHYRNGYGTMVTVDATKIDLSNVDPSLFKNAEIDDIKQVNLEFLGPESVGLVYGKVDLKWKGNNEVEIMPNMYDFDYGAESGHPWNTLGGFIRNCATVVAGFVAGKGTPYLVWFQGRAKLDPNYDINHQNKVVK